MGGGASDSPAADCWVVLFWPNFSLCCDKHQPWKGNHKGSRLIYISRKKVELDWEQQGSMSIMPLSKKMKHILCTPEESSCFSCHTGNHQNTQPQLFLHQNTRPQIYNWKNNSFSFLDVRDDTLLSIVYAKPCAGQLCLLHGINVPYTVESDRRIICDFCCTIPSWNAEQIDSK